MNLYLPASGQYKFGILRNEDSRYSFTPRLLVIAIRQLAESKSGLRCEIYLARKYFNFIRDFKQKALVENNICA